MRRKPEHFHIHKLKRTYNRQTDTFTINISYETAPATPTNRTKQVAQAFGLGTDQTRRFTIYDNTTIHIRPTDIVLITGDSGSGKSALLKALKTDLATEAQDTHDIPINENTPIIDTIGKNTTQALQLLSKTGLNDAFLFLRTYQQLSDGQKHRYHIAQLAQSPAQFWLLEEFTSTRDHDTAKIVAYNLQKLARQQHKAAIAANTHTDLKADLAPNVDIHKRYGKTVTVQYHPNAKAKQCTLTRQTRIAEDTLQDYKQLSQFHYRTATCPHPEKSSRSSGKAKPSAPSSQLSAANLLRQSQNPERHTPTNPTGSHGHKPRSPAPQIPRHRIRHKTRQRNPPSPKRERQTWKPSPAWHDTTRSSKKPACNA